MLQSQLEPFGNTPHRWIAGSTNHLSIYLKKEDSVINFPAPSVAYVQAEFLYSSDASAFNPAHLEDEQMLYRDAGSLGLGCQAKQGGYGPPEHGARGPR